MIGLVIMARGQYLLRLEAVGCHRLGENTGCWRVRCNLGGECYLAEQVRLASPTSGK